MSPPDQTLSTGGDPASVLTRPSSSVPRTGTGVDVATVQKGLRSEAISGPDAASVQKLKSPPATEVATVGPDRILKTDSPPGDAGARSTVISTVDPLHAAERLLDGKVPRVEVPVTASTTTAAASVVDRTVASAVVPRVSHVAATLPSPSLAAPSPMGSVLAIGGRIGLGMCESMGFSDVGAGFAGLFSRKQGFWGFAKNLLRIGSGVGRFLGELTGVTDVIMIGVCCLRGDFAMAGMHLAFAAASIGSLVATVATLGAAGGSMVAVMAGKTTLKNALLTTLHVAAKEFFGASAKEIGKTVVKEVSKDLNHQVLAKLGQTVADQGIAKLTEQVAKKGADALTHEAVRKTFREVASQAVEKALRAAGVDRIVEKLTFDLLKSADKKSIKELSEDLLKMGIKDSHAAAKSIKRALASGKADNLIKEILEEGISKPLREHIEAGMEQAFKERLRNGLFAELKHGEKSVLGKALQQQAKKLGKDAGKLADEFVEEGWKGCKEGIEQAVRKVVREGIDKAFKRFRDKHQRDFSSSDSKIELPESEYTVDTKQFEDKFKAAMARDSTAVKKAELLEAVRERKLFIRVESDLSSSRMFRNTYEELPDGRVIRIEHQALGEELVDAARKAEKKSLV